MVGYIYIMINAAFPDLIKIGRTARQTDERASELYTTGTPGKFVVVYDLLVDNCIEIERQAHELLADKRYSDSREFFKITPKEAIDIIQNLSNGRLLSNESLIHDHQKNNSIFEGELVKYYFYCAFVGRKNQRSEDKFNIYRFGLIAQDKFEEIEFDGRNNLIKSDSWDFNNKAKFEMARKISNYYSAFELCVYNVDDVRFKISRLDFDLIHEFYSGLLNKNYKEKLEMIIHKEIRNYLEEEVEEKSWNLIYDEQTLFSSHAQGYDDDGALSVYTFILGKLEEFIDSKIKENKKISEDLKIKNIKNNLKGNF